MHDYIFNKEGKVVGWTDEIGGYHEEGCGWNPYGAFCGECGNDSCLGCPGADIKPKNENVD